MTKNKTATIDFGAIFDEYIEANQKQWAHDRSSTLGASETYQCIRKSFFDKRGADEGYKPDDDYEERWGATERGNIIENNFVVPAVTHHMPNGMHMQYQGEGQATIVHGLSSATPDGLITGLDDVTTVIIKYRDREIVIDDIRSNCIGFEVKSNDPNANLSEEKEKHNFQTHMQMGVIRAETKWQPEFTVILYVNASWLDEITPFVVEFDQETFDIGVQRAKDVFEVDDPEMLIPEGRLDGSCEYCKWKDACGTIILEGIPEDESGGIHGDDLIALEKHAQEYQEAQAKFKEAEKAKKLAQERVKEILMDNGTRKNKISVGSVSWSAVKGRTTYDTKQMEEDGVDLTPYKKEGRPYDKLTITIRKPKNEQ